MRWVSRVTLYLCGRYWERRYWAAAARVQQSLDRIDRDAALARYARARATKFFSLVSGGSQ